MPTSTLSQMIRNPSSRWLVGLDAAAAILLMAFIATWALTMPSPAGVIIAATVALCFPAAMVLGVVNGIAIARASGIAP